MERKNAKKNPARYITVYNKILKNIIEGLYSENNKLPSENTLAKQMDVSRMTLRQALALLQEDGIIEAKKGVGHFIKPKSLARQDGLEAIGPILKKIGVPETDKIICEYYLDSHNLYTDKLFERPCPIVLGISLFYYNNQRCVAQSFSALPTDLDILKTKDLNDIPTLTKLVTDECYQIAKMIQYEIKSTVATETTRVDLEDSGLLTLVSEKLFDATGEVICFTKYYLPLEQTTISVNSYQSAVKK